MAAASTGRPTPSAVEHSASSLRCPAAVSTWWGRGRSPQRPGLGLSVRGQGMARPPSQYKPKPGANRRNKFGLQIPNYSEKIIYIKKDPKIAVSGNMFRNNWRTNLKSLHFTLRKKHLVPGGFPGPQAHRGGGLAGPLVQNHCSLHTRECMAISPD